jgi:ligand-binding sensor domain-containing protein
MRKLFFLLFMVLAPNGLSGQTFTNYTTANSLLCNDTVLAIELDSKGNSWFCTANGVSKFDGINWTTYTKMDGLAHNYVRCMTIDSSGNKWFGTWAGISKFTDSTWTTYMDTGYYTAIKTDAKNNVWVTSSALPGTGVPMSGQVVTKFDGVNWEPIAFYDEAYRSIAIDSMDNKWFSTYGYVGKYDDVTWVSYDAGMNKENYSIAFDKKGVLWSSDATWFDGNVFVPVLEDNMLVDFYFCALALAIDSKNNKWFGGTLSGGVWKYDESNWTNYTTDDGLVNSNVLSIAIDKEDNIWFGTMGGVSKFVESEVTQVKDSEIRDIKLYPIPVADKLTVSFSKPKENTTIEIFSIDGIKLCSVPIYNEKIELDMSNYPSGTYIVRFITLNEGVTIKQIIKAKH